MTKATNEEFNLSALLWLWEQTSRAKQVINPCRRDEGEAAFVVYKVLYQSRVVSPVLACLEEIGVPDKSTGYFVPGNQIKLQSLDGVPRY